MSNRINELNTKRNKLIADAQVLVNEGKANSEEYRAMIAEIDDTADLLNLILRADKFVENLPIPTAVASVVSTPESQEQRKAKLNDAFRQYFRTNHFPQEYRDIFTGSTGSPLIPHDVFPILGEVAKYFAPVLDYVTVEQNTNGHPQKFITENDSTNFLTVATEGGSNTETDASYSETVYNYDLIRGNITASMQLFEDSNFDLTKMITKAGGKRLGRTYESIIVNGVDPASNAAPNNQGLVNAASVGTTTATLAAGIGMPDLAALVESLDPTYWSKAVFLMSGGTYLTILKQVDGSGRRFWKELGEGRLWQWPVVIANSLPQTFTANGLPILFGDLSTYGVAHTGLSVQVLMERYADQLKRGFQLSSRIASQQLSPGGIKALKLAAS